jgi:hypothetical protein
VQTRAVHLFVVSLAVGAFGALIGRLLTWFLAPGFDFGIPPYAYAWISPAVLFVSAAASFAIVFGVLPGTRDRAIRAGCIAAIVTYVCHAVWMGAFSSAVLGAPGFTTFLLVLLVFVVIGWVPIVSGLFAGWCVGRWQNMPAAPETHHPGSLKSAALEFGMVAALLAVPLIFIVFTQAKPSRVDFAVFFPSAPFLVFALATAAFPLCYAALPAMSVRGGLAGALAGAVTFTCFLFWIRFAINISSRNGTPWGSTSQPFSEAFLLVGWVPLVFGALMGVRVARRLKYPNKVA